MPADQASRGGVSSSPPSTGGSRVLAFLTTILEIYCVVLMLAMALIVLTGVWYRYVVQHALPWYDEFAEFLLVWLTFYGAVLAAQRDAHIGFETLVEYFPAGVQRVVAALADVIVLVIQAALFFYGLSLARAAAFDTAVSIRWVRLSWVYSAIPASGALIFLITLGRLAGRLRPARS